MQFQGSADDVRKEALQVLHEAKKKRGSAGDPRLDLLALALRAKKQNFGEVIKLIVNMRTLLGTEQGSDDKKKASCEKELFKAEEATKTAREDLSDLSKATEEGHDKVKALTEEVATVAQGMKSLDAMVKDAGDQRKAEHKEYIEILASNNAAKQLLKKAKHRIIRFY